MIPPPIGGWNTRDDPMFLKPGEAIALINMVPKQGYVEMRGGYESYSTNIGSGDVDLCVEYFDGASRILLTASPTNIYDSTAVGSATSLKSGFSNGKWDTVQMNAVMAFVNGADTPQKFDGTTLSDLTITGSGLTPSQLAGCHVHKNRSYFWEADQQSFWYSAVNALGGTLSEFQLGQIAKKGGKIVSVTSWTIDGGSGPDDYAVFIMSSGEVLVYQGSNPGSALDWALVGIYETASPVSGRAVIKVGKEVAMIGEDDMIMMPSAFATPEAPTSKLAGAITDAVSTFGSNYGWEMFWYKNESLLIINVPVTVNPDSFEQYVVNLRNGASCRFTGLNARTWGMYNDQPYFGGSDGTLYRYDTVNDDLGSDIDCTALLAWSDYGNAANKTITAVRPWLKTEGPMELDIRAGYDFVEPDVSSPSSSVTGGTPWGSPWGSSWGTPGENLVRPWRMCSGRGTPVSLKMRFSRQGDKPRWYKNDVLLRGEGNL